MKEQYVSFIQPIGTSCEPYPYADKNTFEFLQTVVRDGTQNTIPMYVSEEGWIRNKNITGIYFSCNITQEELADMYGLTRQRIYQIISKTLLHFWENSIGSDQMQFPIDSLSTENPAIKHRINGISRADQIRLDSLISSGVDDEEVVNKFGVSLDRVRQTMRRMGKREQITSSREVIKRIVNQLETLPVENYEERQKVMDQVTLHCYKLYRKSFATISDVAAILGRKAPMGGYLNADKFVDELKGMKVPVGMRIQPCSLKSGEGVGKRNIFVHKKDYERLKEKLGLPTNPSETPSSAV